MIFLIYNFIADLTLVLKHCWEASEFWFYNVNLLSPFSIFSIVFVLLFLWAGFELFILYKKQDVLGRQSVFILSIFLFLTSVSFIHFRLYQSLEVTRGEAYFYDVWPNSRVLRPPVSMDVYASTISWRDFLYEESCANQLDPHQLSWEEINEFYKRYKEKVKREDLD